MTEQEKFLKEIGGRLAIYRKKKNISQEKLADMVNVHRTYIGFIEQGVRNPSIGNVYKIAKALDVTLEKLFTSI